jgi:hypothetical protein
MAAEVGLTQSAVDRIWKGVRAAASPPGHLEAVRRPAVRGQDPRRRRSVSRSARARGGAVRGGGGGGGDGQVISGHTDGTVRLGDLHGSVDPSHACGDRGRSIPVPGDARVRRTRARLHRSDVRAGSESAALSPIRARTRDFRFACSRTWSSSPLGAARRSRRPEFRGTSTVRLVWRGCSSRRASSQANDRRRVRR